MSADSLPLSEVIVLDKGASPIYSLNKRSHEFNVFFTLLALEDGHRNTTYNRLFRSNQKLTLRCFCSFP